MQVFAGPGGDEGIQGEAGVQAQADEGAFGFQGEDAGGEVVAGRAMPRGFALDGHAFGADGGVGPTADGERLSGIRGPEFGGAGGHADEAVGAVQDAHFHDGAFLHEARRGGVAEDFLGASALEDAAVPHEEELVAQGQGLLPRVGDEEGGRARGGEGVAQAGA